MVFASVLALVSSALVIHYALDVAPLWTFATAVAAIVPLAELIRRSTEAIAERAGGAIGGLLNVTFGNMAELVLALFVLFAGHPSVVKAQITGSIIGNGLLGFGLAIVVGTWGRRQLRFKAARASHVASLLNLAFIALLIPALFNYTERGVFASTDVTSLDEKLSLSVAVVLIGVYATNLVYTLVTHRDVFAFDEPRPARQRGWTLWQSIGILVISAAATGWMAELVSDALEPTARAFGMSTFFLGIVVLAVVGNAAEYLSSIYFARRGSIALVASITVGSTIQVALLAAPLLVIVSNAIGRPMNLVFDNPLELIAIASVALIVNGIIRDGEVTWFEGVLLVAVYVLLAIAFYFATPQISP